MHTPYTPAEESAFAVESQRRKRDLMALEMSGRCIGTAVRFRRRGERAMEVLKMRLS
jgi:hypothetical protein